MQELRERRGAVMDEHVHPDEKTRKQEQAAIVADAARNAAGQVGRG